MATVPVFVVHDGRLENTADLGRLGLHEGAKLFLVSAAGDQIVLRREEPMFMGMTIAEYMAGWRNMLGAMPDGKDTSEERRHEKREEAEREKRKFGE